MPRSKPVLRVGRYGCFIACNLANSTPRYIPMFAWRCFVCIAYGKLLSCVFFPVQLSSAAAGGGGDGDLQGGEVDRRGIESSLSAFPQWRQSRQWRHIRYNLSILSPPLGTSWFFYWIQSHLSHEQLMLTQIVTSHRFWTEQFRYPLLDIVWEKSWLAQDFVYQPFNMCHLVFTGFPSGSAGHLLSQP